MSAARNTKVWYVMHEKADQPVCFPGGGVKEYASEEAALREAEALTLNDPDGYCFYILERTILVSPIAKTTAVRL